MWIIYIFVLIIVGSLAYSASSGAPWVPTWNKDLKRIQRLLDLKAGDKFIELGSGSGRVCRYLAKTSEADVSGIELSLLQYAVSLAQNQLSRSGVKSLFGNIFNHDLSKYNAVYLFLMPDTYLKIKDKFEKELRPGTRVVSYVWPIPEWEPIKIDKVEGSSDLYLYIVKK